MRRNFARNDAVAVLWRNSRCASSAPRPAAGEAEREQGALGDAPPAADGGRLVDGIGDEAGEARREAQAAGEREWLARASSWAWSKRRLSIGESRPRAAPATIPGPTVLDAPDAHPPLRGIRRGRRHRAVGGLRPHAPLERPAQGHRAQARRAARPWFLVGAGSAVASSRRRWPATTGIAAGSTTSPSRPTRACTATAAR